MLTLLLLLAALIMGLLWRDPRERGFLVALGLGLVAWLVLHA
jgi:hypothetical protein